MQNPFLADRNIFSKVPNPIRKIADTKPVGNETIKAGLPDEGKANTNDYQYHSVNSPFAHNEQKSPLYKKQSTDSGDASNRQEVKITFGQPRQSTKAEYVESHLPYESRAKDATRGYQVSQAGWKGDYKAEIRREATDMRIEVDDGKRQVDFRELLTSKSSQYEKYRVEQPELYPTQSYRYEPREVSPIGKKKIDDSQFLTVDAMSEDITKFLSLPNSQDEIYKILGIKAPSAGEKDSERYRDKDKGRDNQSGLLAKREMERNPAREGGKPSYLSANRAVLPIQKEKGDCGLKNTFGKNENNLQDYYSNQQATVLRSDNSELLKAHRMSEVEEEKLPSFKIIQSPSEQQIPVPQYKKTSVQSPQPNIRDYSSQEQGECTAIDPNEGSISSLIKKEMSNLFEKGSQRIFLTTGEKIITVPYKLLPL